MEAKGLWVGHFWSFYFQWHSLSTTQHFPISIAFLSLSLFIQLHSHCHSHFFSGTCYLFFFFFLLCLCMFFASFLFWVSSSFDLHLLFLLTSWALFLCFLFLLEMALCTLSFPSHLSRAAASDSQKSTSFLSQFSRGADLVGLAQYKFNQVGLYIYIYSKSKENYTLVMLLKECQPELTKSWVFVHFVFRFQFYVSFLFEFLFLFWFRIMFSSWGCYWRKPSIQ